MSEFKSPLEEVIQKSKSLVAQFLKEIEMFDKKIIINGVSVLIIGAIIVGVFTNFLAFRKDHQILEILQNKVENLEDEVISGNKDLRDQIEKAVHMLVDKINSSKDVIDDTKQAVNFVHPHLQSLLAHFEKMDPKEVDEIITKTEELPENKLAKWLVEEKDFSQEHVGNVLSNKLRGYGAFTTERLFATCDACHGPNGISNKNSPKIYGLSATELKRSFEHASSLAKEGAIIAPNIHELTQKYTDQLSTFIKENKDSDN
jgi:hypothetical protein